MPAGVEIINQNNHIVIDGKFRNYALKQRGFVSCGTFFAGANARACYAGNVSVSNCVAPIVAFRCAYNCFVTLASISGTTWTFRFAINSYHGEYGAGYIVGGQVEYFVFDLLPAPDEDSGLAVYNESGQLVFSSTHNHMRVLEVLTGDMPSTLFWTPLQSKTYTGKKPALCQNLFPIYTFGAEYVYQIGVAGIAYEDDVTLNQRIFCEFDAYNPPLSGILNAQYYSPKFNYLVIDVDGL